MSNIKLINAFCADQNVDVDAYYNSLKVLMDNGFHSISFPLVSSGIFGGSLSN